MFNYWGGYSGQVLTSNGSNSTPSWQTPSPPLPDQSGYSGKLLTTDGTNASWSNDISVNNLDVSGDLIFYNLETDNTPANQDLSYNANDLSDNDNYDYAFVRINKNTGKISRCKYSPGQIIFYSDFCATDNHNVDFSPVRIYIEAKLMMPLASSNAAFQVITIHAQI